MTTCTGAMAKQDAANIPSIMSTQQCFYLMFFFQNQRNYISNDTRGQKYVLTIIYTTITLSNKQT